MALYYCNIIDESELDEYEIIFIDKSTSITANPSLILAQGYSYCKHVAVDMCGNCRRHLTDGFYKKSATQCLYPGCWAWNILPESPTHNVL